MPVKLPDFTAVGFQEPSATDVRPSYYSEDPEAAGQARIGASLEKLGTGIEQAGTSASLLGGQIAHNTNLANAALAQANLHTNLARTKAAIDAENDPAKVNALVSQLPDHLGSASQLIQDPGYRDLWLSHHAPEVTNVQLDAEKRQRQIYNDRFLAGVDEQVNALKQSVAQNPDPAARQKLSTDLGTLYASLVDNGVLSKTQAQNLAHKGQQDMIIGRSQFLEMTNQHQAALDNLTANLKDLDPSHFAYAHELFDRAETQGARNFVRGQQSGGGALGPPPTGPVDPQQYTAEAEKQGVPAGLVHATAAIESDYGKNTANRVSPSNTGIFQRAPANAPGGMNDSYENQIRLGVQDLARERADLRGKLGREPTNAEVYLAHQQGPGGAAWLITHPNEPAGNVPGGPGEAPGSVRISNNGGDPNAPASQFVSHWRDTYNRRESQFSGIVAGQAPSDQVAPADGSIPGTMTMAPTAMEQHVPLPEMLRRIETSGQSPEWQTKAIAEAHRAEAEFQSVHHAEKLQLQEQMKSDLQSRAQYGEGNPAVTPQRITFLEGPEAAQKHAEAQDQMMNYYGQTSDFSQLPYADLNARVLAMSPQPGQDNFPQQAHLHTMARVQADQILALRDSNPALAVAQAPAVKTAATALAAAPTDPAAIQAYSNATLAEQGRLGILPEKQAVLTNEAASRIASQFANADPAQVDQSVEMQKLAALYGPDLFPKVMKDLVAAKLPEDAQILAALSEPNQVVAAQDYQRMLRTEAQKPGILKSAAGADTVKELETEMKTNTTLDNFRKTTSDPKLFDIIQKGVQNLALYYAFRGADGTTAVRNAAANILDIKYDFEGPLRVPKGMLGVVERAGDAVKQSITPEDLRADMPGAPGLPVEYNRQVMADAIQRGDWITNPSDDGALLYLKARSGATLLARRANGNPIGFKFAQAPELAQYAPGGAETQRELAPFQSFEAR